MSPLLQKQKRPPQKVTCDSPIHHVINGYGPNGPYIRAAMAVAANQYAKRTPSCFLPKAAVRTGT